MMVGSDDVGRDGCEACIGGCSRHCGLEVGKYVLAICADASPFDAEIGQAQVRIVGAKAEAVFGTGGEHAVWLGHATGDQIIDEDADIGLGAGEFDGSLVAGAVGGVDAGDDALGGGFFVAGGAVNLAGEEQALDLFEFETVTQGPWVDIVIFYRVAGLQNFHLRKAGHGLDEGLLDGFGQAGGDAVGIDDVAVQPFGFQKHLVAGFIGETDDFVLDGGAVARADTFDLTAIDGGLMQIIADDPVGIGGGFADPAGDLRIGDPLGKQAKRDGLGFAVIGGQIFPIDGGSRQAGRGAGFEATERQAEGAQAA